MHQFFVKPEQIGEKDIIIEGTDVNHIRNVLRMKEGEELTVCTGQDDKFYRCEVAESSPEFVRAKIMWIEESGAELPSKIYLFQGLPKSDKMELIIQKAVELGAYQIVPVAMKNCVVKLDAKKAENKVKRWQEIAKSAAKQSKRSLIPTVEMPLRYEDAISLAVQLDVVLVPYENERGMEATRSVLEGIRPGQSIGIFIGPEGGFAEDEIALAKSHDMALLSLGRRILRTETAGLAMLSILTYQLDS